MTTPARSTTRRTITALWTLAVPALVIAGTLAWTSTVRGRLPEPAAVHWGSAGPDRAGGFGELVTIALVLVAVISFAMWALATFLGQAAMTRRLAHAVAAWFAVFMAGVTTTTVAVQLDMADWTEAGNPTTGMVISLAIATTLAAVAAIATPGDAPSPTLVPVPADAARLDLAASESAVWVRSVRQSSPWLLVGSVLVSAVVLALATRNVLLTASFTVLLTVPLLTLTSWVVRVDRSGLTAASRLGWPRQTVPLDEVESATARQVKPLSEFGGWGLRTALDGTTGVVLRKGEGVEVQRTGGRRFVVTVDDAESAAALLNTLADRAR